MTRQATPRQRFFREYDAFLTPGQRDSTALTRLDARYHAIIEHGREAIEGARILDIASHNGRWSIAALHSGAEHVVGVEGRQDVVDVAVRHMKRYGVPESQYDFIVGDVHKEIVRFEPGQFDTILCLGFFYHTAHHFQLLEEFERLAPKNLIIDTGINSRKGYEITLNLEDSSNGLMAIGERPRVWTGRVSKKLLEDALVHFGFEVRYFDWAKFLSDLDEPCSITKTKYADGGRITVHARRMENA